MTLTTLVTGGCVAAREAAIARVIDASHVTALILEGLPESPLAFTLLANSSQLEIARIVPGCVCCSGNLTLRVTLNRILRHFPERLYISLSSTATHLDRIRSFLIQPPYDAWLTLSKDICV